MNRTWLDLAVTALLVIVASAAGAKSPAVPEAAPTAVVQRIPLGQAGGWDYLSYDATSKRLFITRGDRVMVMAADTGEIVGEVEGTDGVHGVVLLPALNKGFSTDGKSNTVTVFDAGTYQPRRKIALKGEKPDAILYDPASRHVFAFNGHSNNVSVIDPVAETEIATIALDGNPEFAAADGHGHIYVNLEDKGAVTAIDSLKNRTIATWPLGDCEEPTGLALDIAHHHTFSTCQNRKMVVLDVRTGKVVTALEIGEGPDAAAFDARRQLVYSSNGAAGTLSIYRVAGPARFDLVATVPTQTSARTMALDVAGNRVFLAAAEFGTAPEPTAEQPRPRAPMKADSFGILVVR